MPVSATAIGYGVGDFGRKEGKQEYIDIMKEVRTAHLILPMNLWDMVIHISTVFFLCGR